MPISKKLTHSAKASVLIVDDQPIVREHLRQLINKEADLHACGDAEGPLRAFELIAAQRPDVVVTGLALKGAHGFEFIKDIGARYPHLPVLVFSMYEESLYADRAIRAGASGFVSKHGPTKEVLSAIRRVLAGHMYLSKAVTERAVEQFFARSPRLSSSHLEQLSDRELEVFELIGQGRSSQNIADKLHVDLKTIETYRSRIKVKLKLSCGAELARYAQLSFQDSTRKRL